MSFGKCFKNQILALSFLSVLFALVCVSIASAQFTIRDGETRTTTQFISDDETGLIQKGGAIKTTGAHGIEGEGDDDDANGSTITNFGSISTMGNDSNGVFFISSDDTNAGNLINNYGSISTKGDGSHGVYFMSGDDDGENLSNTVNNYGSISTKGDGSNGIYFQVEGDDDGENSGNTVNNYGSISTKGDGSNGIYFQVEGDDDSNNSDNMINNYGHITTMGSNSHGIFFDVDSEDDIGGNYDNTFNNYGHITTMGSGSNGIYLKSDDGGNDDNIINNFGYITTMGSDADGIYIEGDDNDGNIINNYGAIKVKGPDSIGLHFDDSSGEVINNYGGIFATGMATEAIAFHSSDGPNTLNLFPTSQILGTINMGGDGIVNFMSRGAGSSSALSFMNPGTITTPGKNVVNIGGTTGTYFVVDPSGQSISGAALGTLTEGIHNTVGNRSRFNRNANPTQLASARVEPGMMSHTNKSQVWVSGLGSHRQRQDDGQVLAYDHDYYGGVAGYEMSLGRSARVGALGGYVRSDIATDFTSIQTDTDSYFGGVYGQMKFFNWLYVDASFLIGYEDHDNDRLVVDNINGFETAEGDFDSVFISPSFTLSVPLKVNNKTEIRPSGSLNYSASWHDSYTETGTTQSNLSVDDRTVEALIGKIQMAVFHQFSDNWAFETRIGGRSRHTFSDFNANLAGATFATTTYGDDHVFGGFFGANVLFAATDRFNVTLDAEYSMTEGDETNIASQLGLEFTF